VWGSEITSEDAALQGRDERENRIRKISTLAMRCLIFKLFMLSGSKPIQKTEKKEKTEKIKINLSLRSESLMLAGSKLFQKTEKTKKIGIKTEKKLKENGKRGKCIIQNHQSENRECNRRKLAMRCLKF
jgi:hypothetical protein